MGLKGFRLVCLCILFPNFFLFYHSAFGNPAQFHLLIGDVYVKICACPDTD